MGTFAGDAIGMPWRKSRAAPQKYTLGIRFWRKNRGIPRKQPRIGTPAKVSRSAQQENTKPRHSALRRPSPIPVTSVGRLGFCARIFPSHCAPRGGSSLAPRFPSLRASTAKRLSLTARRSSTRQPDAPPLGCPARVNGCAVTTLSALSRPSTAPREACGAG